ncbi:MAG: YceD family protein [Aureispira sp.]
MKVLKSFTINFASLADGEHVFDYQIDDKFLNHFEAALVKEGQINVHLTMLKYLNSLELNFELGGTVVTPCDVCAEEFDLPIEGSEQLMVKLVSEIPEQDDEYNVVYLKEGSNSINIAEMLYELIMLSLPIRKVHPLDKDGNSTCDPAVLAFLQEHSVDPNEEDDQDDGPTDSIWDALKNLK